MSRSFKIVDGDLAIRGYQSCEMVDGVDKLIQDLRLWLTEQLGTDRFHPLFGSVLGDEIGLTGGELARDIVKIKGEIRRILQNYQAVQVQKLSKDRWKTTSEYIPGSGYSLSKDEILDKIGDIAVVVNGDVADISVKLQTHSRTDFILSLSV